jgi:hypothetical protein
MAAGAAAVGGALRAVAASPSPRRPRNLDASAGGGKRAKVQPSPTRAEDV